MPPKGSTKVSANPDDAVASGLSLISSFFQRPAVRRADADIPLKKRGRPPAPAPRPGRPAQAGAQTASTGATSASRSSSRDPSEHGSTHRYQVPKAGAVAERIKLKRLNWALPENIERLKAAVHDWHNKTGEWLSLTPDMSFHMYCCCVGIPKGTLHDYVHPDRSRRKALGVSVGRPQLIDDDTQAFAVDVLRRRDRGNEGMNNREAVELVHDLKPELKLEQVADVLRKTIRPTNKKVLTSIVKAQASTSNRSQITVPQQYRWHMTVESALDFCRKHNTGLTPDGKTFEEVSDAFFCGGDETCFLASAGDVKIIGDKQKKKHEVHTANSRVSTTVYRVGFANGATGPTGFLPPGDTLKHSPLHSPTWSLTISSGLSV